MKADVDQRIGSLGEGPADHSGAASPSGAPILRSRLFLKYVALFVSVVVLALVGNGAFEVWFSFQEQTAALNNLQRQQAEAAADKIEEFVTQIQSQIGWTTQLPWSPDTLDQRRFDALRLLRQVPAITDVAEVDASGLEQLKVSRISMDVVGSGIDYSAKPEFTEAVNKKVYYGPVYFRRESEPYMTISLAGARRENGVSIAQVNLKLIWDVVTGIRAGKHGHAYVVDADGRLIAHPDISLVLRNTDMSKLAQVQAARTGEDVPEAYDIGGHKVLTAYAQVHPLGWYVFVEAPIEEAYAPLYRSIQRTGYVLFGALALAFVAGAFLARRMVVPIQALRAGAARIGAGDLAQRIDIKTGDELEALASQFNDMAGKLRESYADLEKKVEDRTADLTEALQQQTATSEVLRVISSSPGELEPVFRAILENATRICDAKFGVMHLHKDGKFKCTAELGAPAAFAEFLHAVGWHRPEADSPLERVMLAKRTARIVREADEDTTEKLPPPLRLAGARTLVAVPMLKDNELIGIIVIYRQEVRPFTEKQIALVENFAAQAVIAIENARLLSELRESLEQQTATADVLRVISSSRGELKPVFETALANATRLCEASFGVLVLNEGDLFRVTATHNVPPAFGQLRQQDPTFRPGPLNPLTRAAATKQPVHIPNLADDVAYQERDPAAVLFVELAQTRTLLIVPMLKEADLIGAIAIYRQEIRPFSYKQIDLVRNFAAQVVIAIENTRLLSELRRRTDDLTHSLNELRAAQDRLVQTEKLASLGQLTAGIAHEIKNPLNFVNNFSSLSIELIDELEEELGKLKVDGAAREEIDDLAETLKGNLGKIVEHGKRADSIVKNMLLHSRSGSGEHRPVDVNALVEESINLAYHGARAEKQGFNITLQRSFDPAAGEADLYPQEVTRVLLNLISNGFYAAHKRKAQAGGDFEPTLSAATRNLGDKVEIKIRDNGTGIPPEVKEKMFNPFFTTKPAGEGTGLGLSISHDIIVKQHFGTIAVDTEPGQYTEFTIVLPRQAAAMDRTGGRA